MLLGEPPRTPYDLNFSLFGIPVRVHPLFWLVALILGYNGLSDVGSVVTWIIAVFLVIIVHEFGHALTMQAYGFQPWITLYGMGGQASYNPGYGSYQSRGSGPLGQILICLAGPGAGFLLVGVLCLGLILAGHGRDIAIYSIGQIPILPQLRQFPVARIGILLNDVFFIGIFWGLLNLLPIYPLDGGQIAREILLKANPRDGIQQSLWLSVFAAAGMAIFGYVQWNSVFMALFFGYLAFTSYSTLEAYRGRGPW